MGNNEESDKKWAIAGWTFFNAERDKKWAVAGWIFFHNDGLSTSKYSSDSGKGRARMVARGNDETAMPI
eukprot:9001261-Heterocapsa_arctica.AAC.2